MGPSGMRSRWLPAANAVVLGWLAAVALSVVMLSPLGLPVWLPVHMFLLGAVSSAILVWSEHFAVAVLHARTPARRTAAARLVVLNLGVVGVLVGRLVGWPWLLAAGAVAVLGAVAAHVVVLRRLSRTGLGGVLAGVVHYYLAAGAALLLGGTLGALLGTGVGGDAWHDRLFAAHIHLNVLGWVLLTVLGTLFMLWPVLLRVTMDASTGWALRWCLRWAGGGLAVATVGLLAGWRGVALAGLVAYLAGVVVAARPVVAVARRQRPRSGAGWQVAAACGWLVVAVLADAIIVAVSADGEALHERLEALGPVLLVGVVGQVLVGALAYLLPVVLGGGPARVRAAASTMERGWPVRLAAANLSVLLVSLPGLPDVAHTAGWWLAGAALIDVVGRGVWLLTPRVPVDPAASPGDPGSAATGSLSAATDPGLRRRDVVGVSIGVSAGLVLTLVAALLASTGSNSGGVVVGGSGLQETEVRLSGMRVRPAQLTVASGVHLRLRVVNVDAQPHDLRLDSGQRTSLLRNGEQSVLDVGEVTTEMSGWCTVAGHRAAGMSLRIQPGPMAAGAPGHGNTHGPGGGPATTSPITPVVSEPLDLAAPFGPGFRPYPAALPPALTVAGTVHNVELTVVEKSLEVAPGVHQPMWTFGGTVPGPVLRGRVGDVFEITLVNGGSLGHGIDFHASALAPQGPMRVLAPGERLVYRFQAAKAGVWLYHCSGDPLLQHVGNGMFGVVIIDPPGLPTVDREYVLVASELYLGEPGSLDQVAKMRAGAPDAWAFNGVAGGYAQAPLTARVGERVRVWVAAAGPSSGLSFHVVGTRFDTVFKEGAYVLRPGSGAAQGLDLGAAQGGFVELTFPEPGRYPFVDHDLRHADGGAVGVFAVVG